MAQAWMCPGTLLADVMMSNFQMNVDLQQLFSVACNLSLFFPYQYCATETTFRQACELEWCARVQGHGFFSREEGIIDYSLMMLDTFFKCNKNIHLF